MSIVKTIKPFIVKVLKDLYELDPASVGFNEADLTINETKPEFEGDYTIEKA